MGRVFGILILYIYALNIKTLQLAPITNFNNTNWSKMTLEEKIPSKIKKYFSSFKCIC